MSENAPKFPFECVNCGHKPTPQQVINHYGDCEKCGDTVMAFTVDTAEYIIQNVVDPKNSGRVLTCVYCGHEYPQATPTWGNQVLTDHIKVCEKHPMRKLEVDNSKLRKALVGLIGTEKPEELKAIESVLRVTPGIERDKIAALNAIHALQDTA